MSCEVCHENPPRYKCPRCSLKTCCLQCVKQHKSTKKCSGVRDKTAYVSIKDFKESNLINDYRFLEDVDRKSYAVCKDPVLKVPARPNYGFLPKKLHHLRKSARLRGVSLKLLPGTFTRHKANTTGFKEVSKGISVFHWRIEWQFPQSNATYTNVGIPESTVLRDALDEYIDPVKADPVSKQRLKRYSAEGTEGIRVFMKCEGPHAGKRRFTELKLDQTLAGNLAHKCVLEFPTFVVVLKQFAEEYTDRPNPTIKTNTASGIQLQKDGEIQTNTQSVIQVKTDCEGQPKMDSEEQPKTNSEGHININSEGHPKTDGEEQPKRDSEGQPMTDSQVQPKTNGMEQPKTDSELQPKTSSEGQIKTENEGQPKIESDVESKVDSEL